MDTDPRALFGKKLRTLRKERNLSQEDLALDAGLDRTYVSGIETGKRNVALVNICKLAQAMGVSPRSLFEFGEETVQTDQQEATDQLTLSLPDALPQTDAQ